MFKKGHILTYCLILLGGQYKEMANEILFEQQCFCLWTFCEAIVVFEPESNLLL